MRDIVVSESATVGFLLDRCTTHDTLLDLNMTIRAINHDADGDKTGYRPCTTKHSNHAYEETHSSPFHSITKATQYRSYTKIGGPDAYRYNIPTLNQVLPTANISEAINQWILDG